MAEVAYRGVGGDKGEAFGYKADRADGVPEIRPSASRIGGCGFG